MLFVTLLFFLLVAKEKETSKKERAFQGGLRARFGGEGGGKNANFVFPMSAWSVFQIVGAVIQLKRVPGPSKWVLPTNWTSNPVKNNKERVPAGSFTPAN